MIIKSIKINTPVERIRGGDIVVVADVEFETGTFSGIGVTTDQTEEGLRKAREAAVKDAISLSGCSESSPLIDVIKTLSTPSIRSSYQKKFENKEISEEEYKGLDDPIDSNKQTDLNNLCDALGIGRIKGIEGGWTMLDAIGVAFALNRHVKALEHKG